MRALAVLERNLVVVEPRLETMLRHADVDSCVTGYGSDIGLVWHNIRIFHKLQSFPLVKTMVIFVSFLID